MKIKKKNFLIEIETKGRMFEELLTKGTDCN